MLCITKKSFGSWPGLVPLGQFHPRRIRWDIARTGEARLLGRRCECLPRCKRNNIQWVVRMYDWQSINLRQGLIRRSDSKRIGICNASYPRSCLVWFTHIIRSFITFLKTILAIARTAMQRKLIPRLWQESISSSTVFRTRVRNHRQYRTWCGSVSKLLWSYSGSRKLKISNY